MIACDDPTTWPDVALIGAYIFFLLALVGMILYAVLKA